MKKWEYFFVSAVVALMSLAFTSCGDDDGPSGGADIVGTWYGTRSYYNPAGGTKYQYLSVTFESNGTGSLDYESPVSISKGYFTYSVSGNTVTCNGAWANSYGDIDSNFTWTLELQGDRLLPQNMYSDFILTKDGSVETDGNGNEIIDNTSLLQQVWVADDGYTVVEFFANGEYEEYELSSPFGNSYSALNTGTYYYDSRNQTILLNNTTTLNIIEISSTTLKLQRGSTLLSYKVGSRSDIPSGANLKDFLCSGGTSLGKHWITTGYAFYFGKDGSVQYIESSKATVHGNKPSLDARGTYSVSGNKITCRFTDVSWEGGQYEDYKNIFPGWTYGQACTKVYTAEATASGDLKIVTPDNTTLYLSPAY